MKLLLLAITALVSIAVQAKNDKKVEVGSITDAELMTMIRNQYESAVANTNLSEISKWHGGVSSQEINTNDWTKTYTYKDGFKFIVQASKREKKAIDRNTKNKITNRNIDKRIPDTKRRIADLERMLANMKQYSLPTEAIKAKLDGENAFLAKLTNKVEVVTKVIDLSAARRKAMAELMKKPKTNTVETAVVKEDEKGEKKP